MLTILAIVPDYIPSITIGIITPLAYLQQQELIIFDHCLEQEVRPSQVVGADVIVTGRNMNPLYRPIYELALEHKIPIVMELDDNLLAVPDQDRDQVYYKMDKHREHLEWMLRSASLVRVYSPALKDIVKSYNENVVTVYAAIDWSLVPSQMPKISLTPMHIVYATSRTQSDPMFAQLLPDLMQVIERYQDQVQLHFLGYHPHELRDHQNVNFAPFEANYQTYFSKFTRFGYAIGLAPMLEGHFYASKTDNKFREYAAAGAVGIYSDLPPYNVVGGVVHNETGLLVSGERGSWLTAIETLMKNPDKLFSIREKASAYVQGKYNLESVGRLWLEHLQAQPSPQPLTVTPINDWWFTRNSMDEKSWVKNLRTQYRTRVPMQWRLRFQKIVLSLRYIAYKLRR